MTRVFVLIFVLLAVVADSLAWRLEHRRLGRLDQRLSCLEHPHGESSVSGHMVIVHGKQKFVVDRPATATGCKP